MASLLNYGAGAYGGLKDILDRELQDQVQARLQAQMEEEQRSNRATEDYRTRSLDESSKMRILQQQSVDDTRRANTQNQVRDDIRTRAGMRPIKSAVSPEEYQQETEIGLIPTANYERKQQYAGMSGDDASEPNTIDLIEWKGLPSQITAEDRLKLAEETAAANQAMAGRRQETNEEREARLASYGPPTIVIGNPNIPGGSQVIPRGQLPEGGAPGVPPAQTREQALGNEVGLDQLDRLEEMFTSGAKDVIGPAEGRLRGIGQQIPGVPVNKVYSDFEAATAAFKNAVIKAITGAQMSEPEARRITEQIPLLTDKPEVWTSKAQQTRKNLMDLHNRLQSTRQPGAGTATPGADLYQEYLNRTQPR